MYIHINISVVAEIRIQIDAVGLPANVHLRVRGEVLFREHYVTDQGSVLVIVVFSLQFEERG